MAKDPTGQILRRARLMQGMTQMQVAALAGINLGQYQRLEYGEREFSSCSMKVGISMWKWRYSSLRTGACVPAR